MLVTGDTGFKGSWLSTWLDDLGATVGGYALAPPTDPSLFELIGLRGEVAHIARRRARPRRAVGGRRGISPRGRLPSGRAAPGAAVVRRPARHPRDERDGCRQPVRGGARLSVGARRGERDERQMLRERRDHPGIPRSRRRWAVTIPTARARAAPRLVSAAYRRSFFGPASAVCVATARAGNVIGGGDWARDRLVPDCVRALVAGDEVVVRHPECGTPVAARARVAVRLSVAGRAAAARRASLRRRLELRSGARRRRAGRRCRARSSSRPTARARGALLSRPRTAPARRFTKRDCCCSTARRVARSWAGRRSGTRRRRFAGRPPGIAPGRTVRTGANGSRDTDGATRASDLRAALESDIAAYVEAAGARGLPWVGAAATTVDGGPA